MGVSKKHSKINKSRENRQKHATYYVFETILQQFLTNILTKQQKKATIDFWGTQTLFSSYMEYGEERILKWKN